MSAAFDNDVVIVGGGPVGAILALALADQGRRVSLLEARDSVANRSDPRALALSYSSRLVLERIGVWPSLSATPIKTIHISQQRRFGRALLEARQVGLPALGYVVHYGDLMHALHERLEGGEVRQSYGASVHSIETTASFASVGYRQGEVDTSVTARLAVVADGAGGLGARHRLQRTRDYRQCALVAEVATSRPHGNVAYERFTASGPAALLPIGETYALVWTAVPEEVEALCAIPESDFLSRLQAHFGDRAGRFISVGKRSAFPLRLSYSKEVTGRRTVFIGNAAQILHPVAGQGINLGMRDAWILAQHVAQRPAADLGGPEFLAAYRRSRLLDSTGGIVFTDALVRTFSSDLFGLGAARAFGLAAFDAIDPLKRFVVRRMTFGASGSPP